MVLFDREICIKTIIVLGVSLILCVGSFTAGVYFNGTDSFLFFPAITGVLLSGLIALWSGFDRGWQVPRSYLLFFVLLYGVYIWASTLWSEVPYNSILFALIFSILPFIFMVFTVVPDKGRWVSLHLFGIGLVVAGLSVWALVQFFFFFDVYGPRIHHPMLNPNNLAVIFNMCLFPALAFYLVQKKRVYIFLSFGLLMLYFAALLVTQSRAAFIALGIAAFFFVLFTWRGQFLSWKKVLPVFIGAILMFAVTNHSSGPTGLARSLVKLPQDNQSVFERQLIWKATLKIVEEDVWLGKGLGTFVYNYPRYRAPKDKSDGYFVHMDPLQFWAEGGLLLPVLFYVVLIIVLVLTLRATWCSTADNDPGYKVRLWLWASFCSLLVLAGHSHVSYHLYMPAPLYVAGFLLALWFFQVEKLLNVEAFKVQFGSFWSRVAARTCLILLFLCPVFWMGSAAAGVYYARIVPSLINDGKLDEANLIIDKMALYSPSNWQKIPDLRMQYLMARLADKKALSNHDERVRVYHEALDEAMKARSFNPTFMAVLNRQAWLHFIAWPDLDPEGRDRAIALLEKALQLNPLLIQARLGLSRIYQTMGDHDRALAILEEGMRYPMPYGPTTIDLYNDVARLRLARGDRAGYNAAIKLAKGVAEQINNRLKKK